VKATPERMIDRIASRIAIDHGGCWIWMASLNHRGYGKFSVIEGGKRKYKNAHRIVYEFCCGPVAPNLDMDHLCRTRQCVNPDHLEPVTRGENIRRGDTGLRNASKTHCLRGHAYTEDNIYIVRRTNKPGMVGRRCRICELAKAKVARERRSSLECAPA